MMQCQQEDGTDDRWMCLLVSSMIKVRPNYSNQDYSVTFLPRNMLVQDLQEARERNERKNKLVVKTLSLIKIREDEEILLRKCTD